VVTLMVTLLLVGRSFSQFLSIKEKKECKIGSKWRFWSVW